MDETLAFKLRSCVWKLST